LINTVKLLLGIFYLKKNHAGRLAGDCQSRHNTKLQSFVSGLDIEAGGFANIEFNPFCSVEGVIYQITSEELQLLDRHVGYPEVCGFMFFMKAEVMVVLL
jgi:hypothetical protein